MPQRNRQSYRLRGYDYAREGAYFVTVVTVLRQHIFGSVVNGEMQLNAWGQVAAAEWDQTAALRPNVDIPAFVVMPNHVHAVVVIHETPSTDHAATSDRKDTMQRTRKGLARQTPTKPTYGKPVAGSLGTIVGAYKGAVTRRLRRMPDPPDGPIWQRNYHDHIIRTQRAYEYIVRYIHTNPQRWEHDTLYSST